MNTIQVMPLEAIECGAILAEAVLDAQGHVLLPAGLALETHHLEALARRGITTLSIQPDTDAQERAARQEALRQRVLYLFRHTAAEPSAQALLHATLAFRLEHLQ
ncbi:MAG: hypothetical protein ACRCTU_01185 [Zoogloea sp.]|uniref:hypothetical protein n=1 Tax=Zoogloea sp. TaxID=49181 RepID=UPI003F3829FA